jgi:hypothetical protein
MIRLHAVHDLRRYTIPQCWTPHTQTQCTVYGVMIRAPVKPGTRPGRRCRLQYVTEEQALPCTLALGTAISSPFVMISSPFVISPCRRHLGARRDDDSSSKHLAPPRVEHDLGTHEADSIIGAKITTQP